MRCLITGGAGFIGSNLAHLLLERGHEVTIISNLSTGYAENLKPYSEAEFIYGDIRDEAFLNEAVAGKDTVFHLAASIGNKRSIEDPIFDASVNVLGVSPSTELVKRLRDYYSWMVSDTISVENVLSARTS